MRLGTYTWSDGRGQTLDVPAAIVGDLAVHRQVLPADRTGEPELCSHWAVSHVPSGRAIHGRVISFSTRKAGVAFAERLMAELGEELIQVKAVIDRSPQMVAASEEDARFVRKTLERTVAIYCDLGHRVY